MGTGGVVASDKHRPWWFSLLTVFAVTLSVVTAVWIVYSRLSLPKSHTTCGRLFEREYWHGNPRCETRAIIRIGEVGLEAFVVIGLGIAWFAYRQSLKRALTIALGAAIALAVVFLILNIKMKDGGWPRGRF